MVPSTMVLLRSMGSSGSRPKTTETVATKESGNFTAAGCFAGGLLEEVLGGGPGVGAGAGPGAGTGPGAGIGAGPGPLADSHMTFVHFTFRSLSMLSDVGQLLPPTMSLLWGTTPSPQVALQGPVSVHLPKEHVAGHAELLSQGMVRCVVVGQPAPGLAITRFCNCVPAPQVVSQGPAGDQSETPQSC